MRTWLKKGCEKRLMMRSVRERLRDAAVPSGPPEPPAVQRPDLDRSEGQTGREFKGGICGELRPGQT